MKISQVLRFVCIVYRCHSSACLFVDSKDEWVMLVWEKSRSHPGLVKIFLRQTCRHEQSKLKPVKRCA